MRASAAAAAAAAAAAVKPPRQLEAAAAALLLRVLLRLLLLLLLLLLLAAAGRCCLLQLLQTLSSAQRDAPHLRRQVRASAAAAESAQRHLFQATNARANGSEACLTLEFDPLILRQRSPAPRALRPGRPKSSRPPLRTLAVCGRMRPHLMSTMIRFLYARGIARDPFDFYQGVSFAAKAKRAHPVLPQPQQRQDVPRYLLRRRNARGQCTKKARCISVVRAEPHHRRRRDPQ